MSTEQTRSQEPADVIVEVMMSWQPGHFSEAKDLADAAMHAVGINPPYFDISLEALAGDLLANDSRIGEV